MKQIAIVVTNLAGSGGEKIAIEQAKLFYNNGHKVVLFLLEDVQKYDTTDLEFDIVPLTKRKDTFKFLGKLGDKIYALLLENKMKQYGKFDLVVSNLPRADRVVKLINHPNKYFVIHISYKAELKKFSKSRAYKKLKLYKNLYKNENIITVAKEIIKDFDELAIKYKTARTIYNPFDFNFIREKAKEKIDIDYEYIISPSAFREQKRYDILLDAFEQIKSNIKLLILAKPHPKLLELIKQRNLEDRVEILGFQQNPYKYIKNAKLLVLSSDREGLPTVVIESLILGTPVVSTDCPTGPGEILTGDLAKWLVPVRDSDTLAKKINQALDSNIIIDKSHIEKFNLTNIQKEYSLLLDTDDE
jgi:glycosyltransferase involved in cell wall biosynthesis